MPFDGQSVPTPIADALRRVLDGGNKWCKYTQRRSDGKHCILGAVNFGFNYHGRPAWSDLRLAVMRSDPRAMEKAATETAIRSQGSLSEDTVFLAQWNNADETTYADIERAIDAFADIERQRALVNA
jgi:hypothetical protein